jgi:hypothetical protein
MWWIEPLFELLRGLGILKDPEDERKAQELVAKIQAQQEEAFARFIEATQPKAERVYVWANTAIALVRPLLCVFAVISPIIWTDRWIQFLGTLKDAGVWGAIALVPAWAWILGRDGVRMILGVVAGLKGGIPNTLLPPGIPSSPPPRRGENYGSRENLLP